MSPVARRRKSRSARFHRRTPPGAPPGLVLPDPAAAAARLHVMAFGPAGYTEQELTDVAQLQPLRAAHPLIWVNADGVGDAVVVQELGAMFGLHRLALEDVVNVHQRAKAERYAGHIFFVARMPLSEGSFDAEQVSFFVGDDFVLTFQERPGGDLFEPVRIRIRTKGSRARCARADLLFHALLDVIVDNYFPLIEKCGERLDTLEDAVLVQRSPGLMGRMHEVRRNLLSVRRAVWPLRDALNAVLREPGPPIGDEARVYLRDVQDHTVQIIDLVENYRDIAAGLTEVHLSMQAQRTNEVMKVLTVMATIFIPLTFIAGVYGMNFQHMPELHWPWAYPALLVAMLTVAVVQLVYFRRRGWLGEDRPGDPDSPGP
ncbi:MAG TPA: magnesium/cobalt transporter CorA [Phycisphaerae bacterium]|nr:magnesium/cobalt transporter CorA [Phycisphaerae bacterium]